MKGCPVQSDGCNGTDIFRLGYYSLKKRIGAKRRRASASVVSVPNLIEKDIQFKTLMQ